MALPPGGIGNTPDGDQKRLIQRADSFAIGAGTRNKNDIDDLEEFDKKLTSAIKGDKKLDPDAEDEKQKLAEHRDEKAQLEAERRGSSSPSHQPFLGLSVLPGISTPGMSIAQAPESDSKKRAGGVESNNDPIVESVSPEILQGLKQAGLAKPIINLDDPRLTGSFDALKPDFVLSLRSNDRVYVWSQDSCHQIVSIGLHESKLESAVGSTVETVVRRSRVDQKSIRSRSSAQQDFSVKDDE